MPLVRAWTRGLWGMSGAAVLVPGGIIAAMVLLALSGSFGRLAGLGQAFSGPALPTISPVRGAPGASPAAGAGLLPVVAAPTAAAFARSRPRTAGAGGGVAIPRPGNPAGRPPTSSGPGKPQPPTAPSPPAGQGCASACTPPAHTPTLVDRVVAVGTSLTSKIPGPVGQIATQLLSQVGATVDQVLPNNLRAGTAHAVTQVGTTVTQLKLP